jgi:hypothetical protein
MVKLIRIAGVFTAALFFAVILTSAAVSPMNAYARCGTGVTTQIWNELNSRQTSDTVGGKTTSTQDISDRSEHHSSNGVDSTHDTTLHVNPDGSSHEHEEHHVTDQGIGGNECYPEMEGKPWKGDSSTDTDKDAKGNRKRHHEEIIEKNGKCEKTTRDWEWNAKGELIKDTGWVTTDIPCSKYNLEVSFSGSYTLPNGLESYIYGPNTAVVHLEKKGDGTYEGKYESVFDVKVTGVCNAIGTAPVTINVTAKEVKFGGEDELEFSVKTSYVIITTYICPALGMSGEAPPSPTITDTHTFTLPAEDGASQTSTKYSINWTFTLKKR